MEWKQWCKSEMNETRFVWSVNIDYRECRLLEKLGFSEHKNIERTIKVGMYETKESNKRGTGWARNRERETETVWRVLKKRSDAGEGSCVVFMQNTYGEGKRV